MCSLFCLILSVLIHRMKYVRSGYVVRVLCRLFCLCVCVTLQTTARRNSNCPLGTLIKVLELT